jgi:hypothetical protein
MTFDGETISLAPSIGNWMLKCRSHYVIDHGEVIMAGPWSDRQVEAERRRDQAAKAHFYHQLPPVGSSEPPPAAKAPPGFWRRVWQRVWSWVSGRS